MWGDMRLSTKICSSCGESMSDRAHVCTRCGVNLDPGAPSQYGLSLTARTSTSSPSRKQHREGNKSGLRLFLPAACVGVVALLAGHLDSGVIVFGVGVFGDLLVRSVRTVRRRAKREASLPK